MAEHVTEAFVEIAALAERLGVSPIDQFPGCWECQDQFDLLTAEKATEMERH